MILWGSLSWVAWRMMLLTGVTPMPPERKTAGMLASPWSVSEP